MGYIFLEEEKKSVKKLHDYTGTDNLTIRHHTGWQGTGPRRFQGTAKAAEEDMRIYMLKQRRGLITIYMLLQHSGDSDTKTSISKTPVLDHRCDRRSPDL